MLKILFHNEITPYVSDDWIFSSELKNNMPSYENWDEKPFNAGNFRIRETNQWVQPNEINSLNFRCDEFIKNHEGLHIVFTGCSNTWATGLKYEEGWAYKTYKKISEETKCSGYFNLGVLGSSLEAQIFNLFRYFKEYGNPDVLFINFPDALRFYYHEDDTYFDAFYKKSSEPILKLLAFQYYLMLDQYCKSNNIQLYSFTWVAAHQKIPAGHTIVEVPLESFDTYYPIDSEDINTYVKKQKVLHKANKFLEYARDDAHPGIAFNDYWSKFIYDIYKKNQ